MSDRRIKLPGCPECGKIGCGYDDRKADRRSGEQRVEKNWDGKLDRRYDELRAVSIEFCGTRNRRDRKFHTRRSGNDRRTP